MTLAHYWSHRGGSHTPLVLLHAFPVDHRMWDGVISRLDGVPVLRIDAPGFGASPVANADGLEVYADLVAQVLSEQEVTRAAVAGLSMGGYTALALADHHGPLVAGLGLLDTKASADPAAGRQARLDMAAASPSEGAGVLTAMPDQLLSEYTLSSRPQVVEQLREWIAEADGQAIAWAQRSMATRPDRLSVLSEFADRPALVLRGSDDPTASHAEHEAMAQVLRTDVVTVPEAGHFSALEDPEAVAAALQAWWVRLK